MKQAKKSSPHPPALNQAQLLQAASLFAALADPSRLLIVSLLMQNPLSVSQLVERSGLRQANVSRHLATLYQANLLDRQREGTTIRYSIQGTLCEKLCTLVCGKLKEDAQTLAKRLAA